MKRAEIAVIHGNFDEIGELFRDGSAIVEPVQASPTAKGKLMSQPAIFLRRDPAEVTPWAETCGEIRCLVVEQDGAAAEVHQVKIHDAKLHYHAHTDEFYYVIDGQGTMTLDGTEIELHQGVVVYVPRGIKHKAVGNLTVLTVCIPRGVFNDIHELE